MRGLKIFTVLLAAALCFSVCKDDKCHWDNEPDAVSEASSSYYFKDGMIKDEKLYALLSNPFTWSPETVIALSTVRCDGTPNIAIIMPLALDKKNIVLSGDSLTVKNIRNTKYARALLRTVDPKTKSKMNTAGTVGCRLLLKLVEDVAEKKRLYDLYKGRMKDRARKPEDAVFMKIIEVYPIG